MMLKRIIIVRSYQIRDLHLNNLFINICLYVSLHEHSVEETHSFLCKLFNKADRNIFYVTMVTIQSCGLAVHFISINTRLFVILNDSSFSKVNISSKNISVNLLTLLPIS